MIDSLANAYNGRSVFVTGHTGFKGSWLTVWLHRLGARVSGYSLGPPTAPSNFAASEVHRLLTNQVEADIRDAARLTGAVGQADPDVVFHLAAQALVRRSYAAPRETLEVNAIGTAAILDAVRARGKPCVVIIVSSDKCYENRNQLWGYREIDPHGGHDPYSASKGCTEIVASSYRRSFFAPDRLAEHGVKLATVRAGNVIGGGDWACDRIVSDVVRNLVAGKPVPVRSPRAVRPWQHVLQPLSGYLILGARMLCSDDPVWCDGWNFGPLSGDEVSVARLVESFIEAWGGGAWEDCTDPSQPHEDKILRLNIEKSITCLHWRPSWNLEESVCRTVRWYRQFYDTGGSMLSACLDDIEAYQRANGAGVVRTPVTVSSPSRAAPGDIP